MSKKKAVVICSVIGVVFCLTILIGLFISNNQTGQNSSQRSEPKSTQQKSKENNKFKKKGPEKYTVKFVDVTGKLISKQRVIYGKAANPPKTPKKKGYYFYSWSRSVENIKEDLTLTPVFLKNGSIPQISVERVNAKTGDKNIAVKILIKNNPGISSLAFDVIYDKSKLKLSGFSYNDKELTGAATVPFNAEADPPCLSMVNSAQNVQGDFTFATLFFDVIGNSKGGFPIVLSCNEENVYNIDEENIKFEFVNGLITVK